MTAIITNDDIKVFNVSNKFGFLNVSDSEDDGGDCWQKPKKTAKQSTTTANKKKSSSKPQTPSNANSVVGLNTAPSQNIITCQQAPGLSKNAKRRARKKKQAAEAGKEGIASPEESPTEPPPEKPTDEEIFQQQLEQAMRLSKMENATTEQHPDVITTPKTSKKKNKKKNPESEANVKNPASEANVKNPTSEANVKNPTSEANVKNHAPEANEDGPSELVEEEEEEEDLFVPVIEDIKDVIKRISKEDEIPITDIPIDNNQLLRKRALELQEVNSVFKLKLNSLLRVGYKYKRKYSKEKEKSTMLTTVLARSDSSKKSELVKQILQHEETEEIMTKQIEELLEEVERERTKLRLLQYDKKGGVTKKVSFSSDC